MERLKHLIKEVLSTPPKKDSCNCGCHSCDNVGNPGVVLNESLVKKDILSENLRYHVDKQLPLTENTFRYGSEAFLNLWAEARALYLREIIHVNDDDKEILLETNLGEYGIYEGKKVPLDLPILEEDEYDFNVNKVWDFIESRPFNNKDYMPLFYTAKEIWDSWGDEEKEMYSNFKWDDKYGDNLHHREKANIQRKENYNRLKLKENGDKKKNPPLGKPKRGGSKKFYVYVRNPKTKKIKKVSFGDTSGLSAKINNPEARQAFAKRHDCANKKDKTKASYWSCRLPRYSKLLGLKSSFSGFW